MRTQKTVTMENIYEYRAPAFGYGYETRYIYKMVAEDGTVYVWKTTSFLSIKVESEKGDAVEYDSRKDKWYKYLPVNSGDVLKVSFTEKGESEYNGEKQTVVNRVKIEERLVKGKTLEEIEAEKKAKKEAEKVAQLDTIKEGDIIMRMPYKQFKEHYSDCETVVDSFERANGKAYIEIIVRSGRLVPSGVRGETFKYYRICFNLNGKEAVTSYKAVCEENALSRCKKEFPTATDVRVDRVWF